MPITMLPRPAPGDRTAADARRAGEAMKVRLHDTAFLTGAGLEWVVRG